MKHLTTLFFSIAILSAHAQSTGQISVSYLGTTNGVYSVQVTNRMQCASDLNFSYQGTVTALTPNAGSITHAVIGEQATVVYQIAGNITGLTITPLGWCGTSGGGIPVVVNMSSVLPVRFGSINVRTYKKK